MISIIDYGVGNLKSIQTALKKIKADYKVSKRKEEIEASDGIILPGVGAFPDAMKNLSLSGLDKVIINCSNKGTPILGICLGMQILFEKGEEGQNCDGLALLHGKIVKLNTNLKIPHMGWNNLNIIKESRLLRYIEDGEYVYFVHSYFASSVNNEEIIASADYEIQIPAAVEKDNIFGVQFHPEKSGETGLKILKSFIEIANRMY